MNFNKAKKEIMSSKTSTETYEEMTKHFYMQRIENENPRLLTVLYKHCLANKEYLLDHQSYKIAIELMGRAYMHMLDVYPNSEEWLDKKIDAGLAKLHKKIVMSEKKYKDFTKANILSKAMIGNTKPVTYNTRKLMRGIAKTQGYDLFEHEVAIKREAINQLLKTKFGATDKTLESARLGTVADKDNMLGLMAWYFEIVYAEFPLTHTKTITIDDTDLLGRRSAVLTKLLDTVCKPKSTLKSEFKVWADMEQEMKERGINGLNF